MIKFKQFIYESNNISISLPEQAKRRAIQNQTYITVDVNEQNMIRDLHLPQWDLTLSIDSSKHNVREIVDLGGRLYHPVKLNVRLIPKRYSVGPEFGYFYHMMLSSSLLSNQENSFGEPYSFNEELGRYQNSGEAYFTYLMHLMQPIISYLNGSGYHGRVIFFTHFDLDISGTSNLRYLKFVLGKDLDNYYMEMTGMKSFEPLDYPPELKDSRWYTNESGLYLNYGRTGSAEKILQSNRARPLSPYRESVARIGNETRDEGGRSPSDEELQRRMMDRMVARGRELEPEVRVQGAQGILPKRGRSGRTYGADDIDDILANIDNILRDNEE